MTIGVIHPNRPWKITAQQNFIKQLPPKTAIIPFEEYGEFWKNREKCVHEQKTSMDSTLTITLLSDSIVPEISFIVSNGKYAKKIVLLNLKGDTLAFNQADWKTNDKILFNTHFEEKYTTFEYLENETYVHFRSIPIH